MKPQTFYMTKAGPPVPARHTDTHHTHHIGLSPRLYTYIIGSSNILYLSYLLSLSLHISCAFSNQPGHVIDKQQWRNGASLLGLWPSGEASRVFPVKHILLLVLGQHLPGWRKLSNLWAFIPQGRLGYS